MHLVAALLEELRQLLDADQRRRSAVHSRQLEIRRCVARELRRALVIPAAALVAVLDRDEGRFLGAAALARMRAPVGEHAARKLGSQRGQEAGDGVEPAVVFAHAAARDATQQPDRVGMPWVAQHRLHRPFLDEAAGVEHAHA